MKTVVVFSKSDTFMSASCRHIGFLCRSWLSYQLCFLFLLSCLFATTTVQANRVQLPGTVKVTDVTAGVATLEIDVTWDNSWRDNFNWDAVWLFLKVKPAGGAWSHVMLQDVAHTASGDFTVMNGKSGSSVVGVYVFRSKNAAGNASTKVTLKYNCGSYTKADFEQNKVFLLAQGVEMVYMPFGAYYLGDGRSHNTLCDATGKPVVMNGEDAVALSQRSAAGVVTSAVASLPAAYPKGYNGYYVMKYELSQEQYVTFLNSLTRAEQETLLGASKLSALSVGDYVFGVAGAASNRNGIILKGNPSGQPYIFANNLNGNAVYGEDGDGQCVACNYLSINDMIAYASWSGLRPMSELEYERSCRAPFPQEPLPGEYVWNTVGGLTKATSLNAGGKETEVASAGSNVNCGGILPVANLGPVRCGIFATGSSTQALAGATYWGVMEMGGNVKELTANVTNTGLTRTANGGGAFSVNAWSVTPAHYGTRGGGFTSPDSLLRTSDRTEATGYFSDVTMRDSTVGFRLVRTLDAGSVTVSAGELDPIAKLCPGVPTTITEKTPASVIPNSGMALTYVWSVKEGSGAFTVIPGETGNTLTYNNFTASTAYQFKRKVVCALGEAETAAVSYTIPALALTVSPASGSLGKCQATIFTASGASSYSWKFDGVERSTTATYVPDYAHFGSASGDLTVSCVSQISGCAITKDIALTVAPNTPFVQTFRNCGDKLLDICGNAYDTKLMADGRCWMVEDLRTGSCNATDFATYYQGSVQHKLGPNLWGVCIASTQPGAGYLYNWQAAMQAANAVYNTAGNPSGNINGNSPTQWQGICPDGWHLPSGGSTGEFQQLYTALGSVVSKIYPGTSADGWRGVLGGYGNGGSVSYPGSSAYYWSSTYYTTTSAYYLYFTSGSVNPQNFTSKYYGFSVRCLKNY